jgi:FAD/FMN-containing dehydrogenase
MTVGADLLVAGSAAYESARRSQIARFDGVRPRAVVRCRVPEDIAWALAFARQEGVHVALRSGGHCFAGRSSTTGIVIDVSGIDEVSVSDGTVAIGAGARLGDVYDALATHDLTVAAGCGPTVGIAGLTLGGGLGILGRSHGLTADQLVGARAVLADGASSNATSTATRICSGRCGEQAAASSRPSRSWCSGRFRPWTPRASTCCGRGLRPPQSSAPGRGGRTRCPTRSRQACW